MENLGKILDLFSTNLTKYRIKNGITQEELADLIDLTPREVTGIEGGKHWTKAEKIEIICKKFNITYDQLFDFEENTSAKNYSRNKNKNLTKKITADEEDKYFLSEENYIPENVARISICKVLGANLVYLRKSANLSQKELSELSKVCEKSISNIENSLAWPSASVIQRLAVALKVPVKKLFASPIILPNFDLTKCLYNLNHTDLTILIGQLKLRLLELRREENLQDEKVY